MSVRLLQQLCARFAKPLRAERVKLPLQTFTRKVCVKLDDQLNAGLRKL